MMIISSFCVVVAVKMSVIPLVPVVVPIELLAGRLALVTAVYGGDSLMLV